jgi:hypothetical protein
MNLPFLLTYHPFPHYYNLKVIFALQEIAITDDHHLQFLRMN